MVEVQERTEALWPRIAANVGLPTEAARFHRLRVNSGRADLRCVLHIQAANGRDYVLRADYSHRGFQTFRRILDRHQAAAEGLRETRGVSVPAILWRDPQDKVALMEFAPGATAFQALDMSSLGLENRGVVLRRIGHAVAALHQCSRTEVKRFWPKPYLGQVSESAQKVRAGELPIRKPKRFVGLCAYLHRVGRRARGQTYQGAVEHGDLHMRNILIAEDQISLIDFANHRGAVPQRDLANLFLANGLHHLAEAGRPDGYGYIAQADWDAFETGYGAPVSNDPVFQFFFAMKLWAAWEKLAVSERAVSPKGERQLMLLVKVLDHLLATEQD